MTRIAAATAASIASRALPVILILSAATSCVFAQRSFGQARGGDSGGRLSPPQAAYDVTFYDLDLAIDTDQKRIDGSLTAVVEVVDEIDFLLFDLDSALVVDSVLVSGINPDGPFAKPFEHDSGRLRIDLGAPVPVNSVLTSTVFYGGTPREAPRPPWIGGFTWSTTASGKPWVGVSCQMDGADIWWPVKDHPSDKPDSVGLRFRVDTSLVAASNGRLRSIEENGDGTHTFNWFVSTPISNYTVTLNLAPYESIEGTYQSVTGESFPFTFWVLPERLEDGRRQYDQFKKELRFLEETLGPYPFRADKYGVAHTPYLGMEHQTIIAYGSSFQNNEFGFDWLHFHELAHEWWANLVTARDWKDFWIHEGFASYMEALAAEAFNGPDAYHRYMAKLRHGIRNAKPVAPEDARSTRQMYFSADGSSSDGDIYVKGAWVLHTLRYLIGEKAFRSSLRRMAYPTPEMEKITDGAQVRLVDTSDFVQVAESVSGQKLGWFFDLYVHQPDLPELVTLRDGDSLRLSWKTPGDLPFPMPLEVKVDEALRRVDVPAGGVSIAIPEGADVQLDPDNWILKAR